MWEDNLLRQRITKSSNHNRPVFPNLAHGMVLTGTDQLWVADIMSIRLKTESVYLAVVLDAFSRRVIGCAIDRALDDELTLAALRMALQRRFPAPGLVHHSKCVVQYVSPEYTELLKSRRVNISMSQEGNLKPLKYEVVYRREYRDLTSARASIEHLVQRVYNQKRLHAKLGYRPEFKQKLLNRVLGAVKQGLTRAGATFSLSTLLRLNIVLNYLWVGHWMKSRGLQVLRRVESREQVFRVAAEEIRDREVLYLEFGVYRGQSMRIWSRLLLNPRSNLHGFDSFEGLPETWDLTAAKGLFAMDGAVPIIEDSRVSFFKGWFAETLPQYILPPHERLFVNFDADLYSSTKTALDFLKPHISFGTYLYFDEFQSREHELKAFDEFLSETGWTFHLVAATRGFTHVLFQRTSI